MTRRFYLIEDFVIPSLNDGRFGRLLKWCDREKGIFQVVMCHKRRSEWTEDDCQVFVEWDKINKRHNNNEKNYHTNSRGRFINALNRLKRKVMQINSPSKKKYRLYQLKNYPLNVMEELQEMQREQQSPTQYENHTEFFQPERHDSDSSTEGEQLDDALLNKIMQQLTDHPENEENGADSEVSSIFSENERHDSNSSTDGELDNAFLNKMIQQLNELSDHPENEENAEDSEVSSVFSENERDSNSSKDGELYNTFLNEIIPQFPVNGDLNSLASQVKSNSELSNQMEQNELSLNFDEGTYAILNPLSLFFQDQADILSNTSSENDQYSDNAEINNTVNDNVLHDCFLCDSYSDDFNASLYENNTNFDGKTENQSMEMEPESSLKLESFNTYDLINWSQ